MCLPCADRRFCDQKYDSWMHALYHTSPSPVLFGRTKNVDIMYSSGCSSLAASKCIYLFPLQIQSNRIPQLYWLGLPKLPGSTKCIHRVNLTVILRRKGLSAERSAGPCANSFSSRPCKKPTLLPPCLFTVTHSKLTRTRASAQRKDTAVSIAKSLHRKFCKGTYRTSARVHTKIRQ